VTQVLPPYIGSRGATSINVHFEGLGHTALTIDKDGTYKLVKVPPSSVGEELNVVRSEGMAYALTKEVKSEVGREAEVLVRIVGKEIIVELVARDLERMVEEWKRVTLGIEAEPFPEEPERWGWIDEKYAKRKLGLLP